MKAGIFYGPHDYRYEEIDDVTLVGDEFDVIVKVEAAGICGSDMHSYVGAPSSRPVRKSAAGHELAGTVVEVVAGVTSVKPGDRVGVEPLIGCGVCVFCIRGDYHLCGKLAHIGGLHTGGFAEYTKAPHSKLYVLPDHISFGEAAVLDCYAVAVHALQRVPVKVSDTVVVIGAGAIGICTAEAAIAAGAAKVVIVDIIDSVLDVAAKTGIPYTFNSAVGDLTSFVSDMTGGLGADVVYETVGGSAPTVEAALAALRPGGTIGHIGLRHRSDMDFRQAFKKELNLIFISSYSRWGTVTEYEVALRMMALGRFNPLPMLTHRYPLSEIKAGFDAMADKQKSGAVKVIIEPQA